MPYDLQIARPAAKDIASLPVDVRDRAVAAIEALPEQPRPPGVKKLRTERNAYRIRVGEYRIRYLIDDHALRITIVAVKHRRDIYR